VGEPLEVDDLRQQDHGRQGVDPPEAAQPADGFRVGRLRRQGFDLFVQLGLVGERLLEGEQGRVECPLQRRH
jgi:hypothetical protein